MEMIKNMLGRFDIARDLLGYLWKERMWWLIPFIFVLLLLGMLIVFAQGSPVTPFIYTLF